MHIIRQSLLALVCAFLQHLHSALTHRHIHPPTLWDHYLYHHILGVFCNRPCECVYVYVSDTGVINGSARLCPVGATTRVCVFLHAMIGFKFTLVE